MKFIFTIVLIVFISSTIVTSVRVSKNTDKNKRRKADDEVQEAANKKESASFNKDLEKLWELIFRESERKGCSPKSRNATITPAEQRIMKGIRSGAPIPRPDYWSKLELGFGRSAHFFDFLDELLRKPIVEEFKKIVDDVKKNPTESKDYEDPYTLSKILGLPINEAVPQTEEELSERLIKVNPGFDVPFWKSSFSAIQIDKAYKENKWYVPIGISDPAKRMIDTYDFNGDGRLSASELVIAVIDVNKSIIGQGKCKNCLEEIVLETIDPIFTYADCDGNDKLSAEELYKSLKYLKRGSNKYNIYLCEINGVPGRTGAFNDFILKSQRSLGGNLTKREFSLGLLIGYWNRQTETGTLLGDESKSRRMDRWTDPSGVDNGCAGKLDR